MGTDVFHAGLVIGGFSLLLLGLLYCLSRCCFPRCWNKGWVKYKPTSSMKLKVLWQTRGQLSAMRQTVYKKRCMNWKTYLYIHRNFFHLQEEVTSSQASLHLEETRLQAFHQVDDGAHGPMAIVMSSNVSHENRKDLLYKMQLQKLNIFPKPIFVFLFFATSAIPKEYTLELEKL